MNGAPKREKAAKDDAAQVREVLRTLQGAYAKKSEKEFDQVIRSLLPSDGRVCVISTSGIMAGDERWAREMEAARKLIESDWRSWGDVYWHVDRAAIQVEGEIAWLDCNAFVEKLLPKEEAISNHLRYIKKLVDGPMSDEEKVAEVARGASNVLTEFMRGERFVWPMRFTAVMQKLDGKWLFRQMHFSFPTTRFPDERLTDLDVADDSRKLKE